MDLTPLPMGVEAVGGDDQLTSIHHPPHQTALPGDPCGQPARALILIVQRRAFRLCKHSERGDAENKLESGDKEKIKDAVQELLIG